MSGVSERNCARASEQEEFLEYEDLLARNVELCFVVYKLVEAVENHRLNTRISTGADRTLWTALDTAKNAEG